MLLTFFLLSTVRAILSPIEINSCENRTAEKMPHFSLSSFFDGTFQDGTESALGDQTFFAIRMKETYNRISAKFCFAALRAISAVGGDESWAEFGGRLYKDGYLLKKMGEKFSLSSYVEKHGITRVMFIGSNDLYSATLSLLEEQHNGFQQSLLSVSVSAPLCNSVFPVQ